jgi:hypothetical protein
MRRPLVIMMAVVVGFGAFTAPSALAQQPEGTAAKPGPGPGPGPTDSTAPTITINAPAQGDTYNKSDTPSVKTDFSCSDPDGPADVKLCQGYVDNDSANPQGSGASLDIKLLAVGPHVQCRVRGQGRNKVEPVIVHFKVTDDDTTGGSGGSSGGGDQGGR